MGFWKEGVGVCMHFRDEMRYPMDEGVLRLHTALRRDIGMK